MARYVLAIPGWRPTLDNELMACHWAIRYRRKKTDAETLFGAALVWGVPRAPGRRRLAVTIYGKYHRGAVPDDPAPLKSLLDALVTVGLLVDDSRQWLELEWPPVYRPGRRATVLVLEDIAPLPADELVNAEDIER